MKRSLQIVVMLIAFTAVCVKPAAAQNRYIVRTTGGLSSVLNLCSLLGCQVQGSLDGNVNQTFLVTSSGNIVVNLLNFSVNLVESLLGIQTIEPDALLPVPQTKLNSISSGLYDTTLLKYYGTLVIHGYAAQPATQIIRLSDAQNGFNVTGTGIVAVIDTGVDPNHPVLHPVLLQGYDSAGDGATVQRRHTRSIFRRDSGWLALRGLWSRHDDFRARPPGCAEGQNPALEGFLV